MSNIDLTLLPDFIVEASEHLDEMESLLLQLVDNPGDVEILNELFRPAHTIKGAAQFMGIEKIAALTHRLEDLLDQLRSGDRKCATDIVEIFIVVRDRILLLVSELEQSQQEESGIDDLIKILNTILESGNETQPGFTEDLTQQSVASLSEANQVEKDLVENEQTDRDIPAEYRDEVDGQELFGIFLNHLQQQVTRLMSLMAGLDDVNDKEDQLKQCAEKLNKLRSSANYMGFEEIGDFYQDWIDALNEAKKSVSRGQDVAFSFMDFYLAELKQHYPQLDYATQGQQQAEGIQDLIAERNRMPDEDDETLPGITEVLIEPSSASQSGVTHVKKDQATERQSEKDTPEDDAGDKQAAASLVDESDRELLDIYLEHLQQQVTQLVSLMTGLDDASDKQNQLEHCIENLSSLRSSANYMGYEEITDFYQGWIDALNDAKKSVSQGRDVAFSFMDFYLAELKQNHPEIDYSVHSLDVQHQDAQQTPSIAVEETDKRFKPDVTDLDTLLQAGAQSQDEDLFSRLSQALDGPIHQVSDTEFETLHSVYDEIVSPQPDETAKDDTEIQKPRPERARVSPRLGPNKRQNSDRKDSKDKQASKHKRSLRVDSVKIDSLMNQVGELVVDRSYFVQLLNELGGIQHQLKEASNLDQKEMKMLRTFNYRLVEAISALGRTSNDLQEGVMKMRMIPISQIFNRYPRLIHDLTHNTDKTVNLIVRGEETELDKMIVEELSDPLVHIIRNAVDHGIEPLSERKQKEKQHKATLILEAYHESNNIIIEVTDDGRGLDLQKIRNKAGEKGLFSEEELDQMSARELYQIISVAGFSTADKITGTSGRGVGMDVVRKNIEKLNGALEIESKPGVGTQMRLKIPLTLAIIHALMVRTGEDVFAIPLANVDETVRIKAHDISRVEGVEVIHLRGQTLPIFRLSSLFNIESDKNSTSMFVVIVTSNNQRTGFVIDELMRQEEVVIKPMVDYVQDKSGFSGATIIGDGRISLILDVYELVRITARKLAKEQNERATYLKSQVKKKQLQSVSL